MIEFFFHHSLKNESVPKSRNYLIKILVCCGWLTLAECQVYTKLLYHFPPQQHEGGGEKIRKKRLVGQDKGSLIKKKQRAGTEAKEK